MRYVKSALIIAACAVLVGCFHRSEPLPGFNAFNFRHGTYTVDIIAEPTPSNSNGETLAWTGAFGDQWVAVNEGFTGGMPLRNMRTAPMENPKQIVPMTNGVIRTAEDLAPGQAQAGLGDTGRDWRVVDEFGLRPLRGVGYILVQVPAEDLRPYMRALDPTLAAQTAVIPGFVYGIGIWETPPGQAAAQPSSRQRQQIRVVFPSCERVEADFRSEHRFVRATFEDPSAPGYEERPSYTGRRYTDSSTQGVLARPGMQPGLSKPLTCTPNSAGALRDVFSEYLLRNRTFSQPHLLLRQ
jgi:hypothetical protein